MQPHMEWRTRAQPAWSGPPVAWVPQSLVGHRTVAERDYLSRAVRKLEALAAHAARTPLVHRIAGQLGGVSTSWTQAVLRVWHWLPTHYVAERRGDHWQSVKETLSIHAGDCEDWALVAAAVLKAMGIDARMVAMPGHVAVALPAPPDVVASVHRGTLHWPLVVHAERSWLFIEATLPISERRQHVPGSHDETIERWADTPYLQIAGQAEIAPAHSSIAR